MRKLRAIIICIVCLFGCSKESRNNGWAELNGKWELRVTEGGFSYEHKTYPAGNGNTITFSGDNQYRNANVMNGEEDVSSGTYSITNGATCNNSNVSFIKFSGSELANQSIVSVSGDSLFLKTNSCILSDGMDYTYVKIEN